MGRPIKASQDKRQQITLRFDPAVMKWLRVQAEANHRSVGKEIEARVVSTFPLEAQGVELFKRISAEIAALTKRNRGKRWHVDLTAWASVAEMLAEGPIQDMRPNHAVDADDQWEAWEPIFRIDNAREEIVRKLAEFGFTSVAVEKKARGLLRLNNRTSERAGIDQAPESDLKEAAIALHTELSQLDVEHDEKMQAFHLAMQVHWEAEEAGRQLTHDYLHDEAEQQRNSGEDYNPLHLMRIFRTWR
ncbi:MAG: hypothetical protein WBH10_04375 [Allopontixanthobacter sediminis]